MSVQLPSTDSRRNQYFIPGEGIARQVITADICKYLDNDALVRPGEYQGIAGFFIFAYRNLTKEMIEDLKADSKRFDVEKRKYSGGHQGNTRHPGELSYTNSRTYAASGPNQPGGTSPRVNHPHSAATRGAQQGDYGRQQPSPYNEPPQYSAQPHGDEYPPASRAPGYGGAPYTSAPPNFQQPRSSFPPSSSGSYSASDDSGVNNYGPGAFGNQQPPHVGQMAPNRDYPQPPATAAPMPGYQDGRGDLRGPPQRSDLPRSGYAEKRPADQYFGDSQRPYSDTRRRY